MQTSCYHVMNAALIRGINQTCCVHLLAIIGSISRFDLVLEPKMFVFLEVSSQLFMKESTSRP